MSYVLGGGGRSANNLRAAEVGGVYFLPLLGCSF